MNQPGAIWIWGSVGGFRSAEPTQLPGVSYVVAAAVSDSNLIVLKDDGTVWLLAPHGQGVSATRVPGLNHITSIAAGASHYLALESDGTVLAWGNNFSGQLGDGTTTNRATPVRVDKLSNVIAIAAKWDHNVAIERDGSAWTWGGNSHNDLGTSTHTACNGEPCSPFPIKVPGIHHAVAAAAGTDVGLVATGDGTVWQWGYDDLAPVYTAQVYRVPGLFHTTALAGGDTHNLALEQDSTVHAWGDGQYGELGNGRIESTLNPVTVDNLSRVKIIAAGHSFSAALTADGSVWTWGGGAINFVSGYKFGDSSTVPVQVTGLKNIVSIAAAMDGLVAIGPISPTAPITVSGAGTSAVDPLLTGPWASSISAATASAGITITYTSTLTTTDEAARLTPWLAGKADFTATDLPLTGSQERAAMQRCGDAVRTVPVAVGGVALTYHLPGIGARLVLPPAVLAPLLLGQIHDWNDVRLQRANPGLTLPQVPIRLVYRADAAADTDTLTRYLTSISPDWKARVGAGMQVAWPTGQSMRGSLGVLAQVLRTPGALGYVALQDALAQHAPLAALRDHAGQDVTPSLASVERAASSLATSLPRDLQQRLIDAPGAGAYPLADYSFLDFCGTHQGAKPGAKAIALRELARYIVTTGQAALPAQHLAPLPAAVQRAVLAVLPAAQQ